MPYRHPIINEVYAVLRLEEGSLTAGHVFDLVPLLKDAGYRSIELGTKNEIQGQTDLTFDARVRCWNEDRTGLIQIATDYLAANHTVRDGEYLGWHGFRQVLDTALNAYQTVMGRPVPAISVEISTIDVLEADHEGFELGSFLNCGGNKIPAWYSDAATPVDLSFGRGMLQSDGFNTNFKISLRIREGRARVRIESRFSRLVRDHSLLDLVEVLHEDSTAHFEELITDLTRNEVMGGLA